MKKILIFLILFLFSVNYSADMSKKNNCNNECSEQLERDKEALEISKNGWWDRYMGEEPYSCEKLHEKRFQILTNYLKCLAKCKQPKKNDN